MKLKHRFPREHDPDATVDARTLSLAATPVTPPRRRCAVGLIDHTSAHLTDDTQSLLRLRLRAAALTSLAGFGLFLTWYLLPIHHHRQFANPFVFPTHVFTIVVTALCAVWLWRPCDRCIWRLRVAEVLIFGVPALFFLLLTIDDIACTSCRSTPSPTHPTEHWIILIFIYSLFIPNGWTRALAVNAFLAGLPVVTLLGLYLSDANVARVYSADEIVPIVLQMAVTCTSATVGAYLINALRREVFEARLLGQYRLGKQLGAGGMGEVYFAEHQMLKRPCAIKVIRPGKALDPRSLARFEREVIAMSRLSHPNTVEIYDYGRTEDGTFFYVMEYLPGMTLHDLVDKYGALPPGRAIHFLRQTCDALAEAHALGLLHRDIKPGNIFAAHRGGIHDVAKLLDFGLVKPVAEADSARLTREGALSGTPHFMSPEQADQKPADPRGDIYSLGAVGFCLLTGRPPFDDASPLSILIAHARDPVPPPSQFRPDLPEDLERVILRCLEKDPVKRYTDTRSLAEALDACRDAGTWSSADAAQWWSENEPTIGWPAQLVSGQLATSSVEIGS